MNFYRQLSVVLSVSLAFAAHAQTSVHLQFSAKPQPTTFLFGQGDPEAIKDAYDFIPVFQADIGFRKSWRSGWFISPQLSYRHTQHGMTSDLRDANNNPIGEDIYLGYYYNFIGLKLGAGHQWRLGDSQNLFCLPAGVQIHLPFASEYKVDDSNFKAREPLFSGDDFVNGIYYGAYLRPGLSFKLSQGRGNYLSLSIFGETDLLIRPEGNSNPILLYGGGVGVGYHFDN